MKLIAVLMWILCVLFTLLFIFAIRNGIKAGYTFSDMLLGFIIQMFFPTAVFIAGFLRLLKVQVSTEVNYGMFLFFGFEGVIVTLIVGILLTFVSA